jgi:hypothetical protein
MEEKLMAEIKGVAHFGACDNDLDRRRDVCLIPRRRTGVPNPSRPVLQARCFIIDGEAFACAEYGVPLVRACRNRLFSMNRPAISSQFL